MLSSSLQGVAALGYPPVVAVDRCCLAGNSAVNCHLIGGKNSPETTYFQWRATRHVRSPVFQSFTAADVGGLHIACLVYALG